VYRQAADIYLRDRPLLVLYHYRWLWGITDRLHGFAPQPDGLIRPQGMALSEH
jgi:peptide/nickel transport system substrate-binding protein